MQESIGDHLATTPHSRLPRLVEGIDLRGLPIGPAQAFVLSRVDGSCTELEIADEAGIEPKVVAATLEELVRLGAVRFDQPTTPEAQRALRPQPRVPVASRIGPIIEAAAEQKAQHPAAALYDANDLNEDVDLELERRRVILETFHRLDSTTHYQLLRVDPSADKRAVKNAYFEIVNTFHPDRYFGKKLGSFKPKLERIFARLTEAHDTLTRLGPRAEYDAYLASQAQTRRLDQVDANVAAQVQAIQRQIEEEARAAVNATPAPPPAEPAQSKPRERSQSPQPNSQTRPRLQSLLPPSDPEARKRALARKLGGRTMSGNFAAATPPSSPTPSLQRTEVRERAMEELKRHYEQRVTQARVERAERYLTNARQSLASKDPISAANALRIAASLVPDNPQLSARLLEAQTETEAQLSGHYLAQAQYEEREGRMAEAARSYARATLGSPNARTFERAAYCALVAEGGDLRTAGEHARRAVQLAPDDVQARVTLARIYVTAGMKQSGLAEFERAATLAPKDDTIRDWIRRLKRGEA
ncbi:MAG TPA: DnaJ domain-containing protein [Polyangiaceae bacterium]|nr:DnaJ domain-containing protein [Polyangiaceae bacterium]